MTCTVECAGNTVEDLPHVGSIITVKYDGCYTTGVLKRPIYWRTKTTSTEHTNSALESKENSPIIPLHNTKVKTRLQGK